MRCFLCTNNENITNKGVNQIIISKSKNDDNEVIYILVLMILFLQKRCAPKRSNVPF